MEPHLASLAPLLIPTFVALNAVFVAAEFALVTLRRVPGGEGARADELVLLTQIGSTVSTLALGAVVAALARELRIPAGTPPWLTHEIAVALGVAAVVAAHLVLGELLPRLVGAQRAQWIGQHLVGRGLRRLLTPLRPLTWPLARLVGLLARGAGLRSGSAVESFAHTPEELQLLVAQSHAHGVVEEDEQEMIQSVFEFSTTVVREVMTPRTDMIAIPADCGLDELLAVALGEEHSRLPVYDGTLDTIVGFLLVKDLLPVLASAERRAAFDLRAVMREPCFVPDTKPVDDMLAEFRARGVHMAIVLDEFGGTYGLLTLEDVLEEIVGEINDEHDVAEPDFTATPEGDVLIDGGTLIHEVNDRFGFDLPVEDYDTMGGFVLGALGRVPAEGDEVGIGALEERWRLRVDEVAERRVTVLRLMRGSPAPVRAPGATDAAAV